MQVAFGLKPSLLHFIIRWLKPTAMVYTNGTNGFNISDISLF
jgi:hypothetical protein